MTVLSDAEVRHILNICRLYPRQRFFYSSCPVRTRLR
jgi:hypothetical protein